MPALTAKEQAAASLSRLVATLQAEETRERMIQAVSSEELLLVLEGRWDAP
jgi:hypothetical protein